MMDIYFILVSARRVCMYKIDYRAGTQCVHN